MVVTCLIPKRSKVTTTTHRYDVHSILSKNYTVWPQNANRSVDGKVQVSYNATTTFLSAFLHLKSQVDPLNVSGVIDLRESLSEWVNVGFSTASGLWVEGHGIHSWDFRSNLEAKLSMAGKVNNGAGNSITMPAPGKSNKNILIVAALSILAVIAGALSLILLILWRRNRTRKDHQEHGKGPIEMAIDEEIENEGGPKRFSYGELFNATNGFPEDGLLGRGGFGSVHKGYLEGLCGCQEALQRLPTRDKGVHLRSEGHLQAKAQEPGEAHLMVPLKWRVVLGITGF